jgi:hypothetical protein
VSGVSLNFNNSITPLFYATIHRKKPDDNEENEENSKRGQSVHNYYTQKNNPPESQN